MHEVFWRFFVDFVGSGISGVLHDWIDISELIEFEELVLTMLLDFPFTDFVGSFEQVGVQLSVVVSIWFDVDG